MLRKAVSFGFYAAYFIADAWFGNKDNISLALECGLTPIFMMKRGKSKYVYEGKEYTLRALYRAFRKKMKKQSSKKYSYFSMIVDYNLAAKGKTPKMKKVKLIFSRAHKAPKDSWVVLLCGDHLLEDEKIFEVYSLRWNIECYFKEIKQYFGFLKEQSGAYETHWASIHLAAMRYILMSHIYLKQNIQGFAALRRQFSFQLEYLSFSVLSWEIISILINQVIDIKCKFLDPEFVTSLKEAIDSHVRDTLHKSLQIDPESIIRRQKAEKLGLLV